MYYNIKIKSKDSEFSLDSTNKDIMQKELDIYFANIFDVSPEFRESIKKIIITNSEVKSIDEVEIALDSSNLSELPNSKEAAPSPMPQQIPEFEFSQVQKGNDKPWTLNEFDNFNFDDSFKSKDEVSSETVSNSDISFSASEEYQRVTQNIDEIVDLAQNEFNSLDMSTKTILNSVNEVMPQSVAELASLGIELEKPNNTLGVEFEDFSNFETETTNEIIFPQSLPSAYENLTPIGTEEANIDKLNSYLESITLPKVSDEPINKEISSDVSQNTQEDAQKFSITPEDFIKENPDCELKDLFLFYSYHIKNTLQQDGFTLKVINAKLFHAIGKIADLSVVDDLLSRGYISLSQTAEYKKYFITPCGEAYFAGKFQK